ncbi:hypothetical protein ACJMK2_023775 [Sinanodonta woodiana]|uniref:Uncharacterized protein n=1 Tax=Sinanodonta woodiana TaxID=1069815 RepID=A0ABD3T6Z4_SINWO
MHLYFKVVVVENGTLLAFHNKGVQLIDFSGNDTAPKLIEVLAALEAQRINMKDISGLQNAGPRKMMLYSVDESKRILNMETMMVKGLNAHIHEAPSFERTIGSKMVGMHFHGLPKKIDTCELERKLHDRFDVLSRGGRPGLFWGYSNVTSGVRIVKVQKEDASRIPAFFYVMKFRVRSWYKDCERDRKCPKCNVVGHGPWACKGQPVNQEHTKTRSYADAVAQNTNLKSRAGGGGQAHQQEQERWRQFRTM